MANSLKSLFPELGRILGETPDTLYGWQRAMVREGLLDAAPGRGPGSGVPANPEAMAQFLIGICCQATRSENAPLARTVAKAPSADGQCPLTGAKTFIAALTATLADESLAARVVEVNVSASIGSATIVYDAPNPAIFWKPRKAGGVQFFAKIWGPTLLSIAKIVAGLPR